LIKFVDLIVLIIFLFLDIETKLRIKTEKKEERKTIKETNEQQKIVKR
jgi:hypothetical protein